MEGGWSEVLLDWYLEKRLAYGPIRLEKAPSHTAKLLSGVVDGELPLLGVLILVPPFAVLEFFGFFDKADDEHNVEDPMFHCKTLDNKYCAIPRVDLDLKRILFIQAHPDDRRMRKEENEQLFQKDIGLIKQPYNLSIVLTEFVQIRRAVMEFNTLVRLGKKDNEIWDFFANQHRYILENLVFRTGIEHSDLKYQDALKLYKLESLKQLVNRIRFRLTYAPKELSGTKPQPADADKLIRLATAAPYESMLIPLAHFLAPFWELKMKENASLQNGFFEKRLVAK
jgi:hypothetical protein